jgi:hypothetical protein
MELKIKHQNNLTVKYLMLFLFFLLNRSVFSQSYNFSTIISRKFDKAAKIALMNKKDTVILFNRSGSINSIKSTGDNYLLKKRKVLFGSNNDTIAFYKRHNIIFPKENIIVNEKKRKDGWEYYIKSKKVVSIKYKFDKTDNNYKVDVITNELNQISLNLIQICLGRFDKHVVMDYDDDDDFSTAIIIATIVALSK